MTATTDRKRDKLTDRIEKAAKAGDRDTMYVLVEEMWELARQDGRDDLLIDLWDAKEIGEDGVEFAIENNGATDPRK